MSADKVGLLEELAYTFGDTYDAYLAVENDRQYFWAPGRGGVIGFVHWKGVLNVLGGLLAPPDRREELLDRFVEFARINGLTANFFNVCRSQKKLFRSHGFKLNKCTEELIVRLDETNWQGKDYGWLRRQENACIRQQLRVEEIDRFDNQDFRERIVPMLEEVNQEHLAGTVHGRELVFFEGRFNTDSLNRRRLFATWQGGEIVAFVVCNPALAGDMWAVEIYRRKAEAPRGVIPFTILQILRQLKDEGVSYASLSSVPFLRCGPPYRNDDLRFEFVCGVFWDYMNWLFDSRGIYHFKSRFRPEYRDMFLATYPKMTVLSMFAMGASWGLFKVSPWRLARHAYRFWRNGRSRGSLAVPAPIERRKLQRPKPRIAVPMAHSQAGTRVESSEHKSSPPALTPAVETPTGSVANPGPAIRA